MGCGGGPATFFGSAYAKAQNLSGSAPFCFWVPAFIDVERIYCPVAARAGGRKGDRRLLDPE